MAVSENAPRELTPPPLQAPTAKERKYDRQLRLWAASGQRALEESHVLLIVGDEHGSNSSVAGVEALKNLILPSIGHYTIADPAKVAQSDLGVNFFLETSSLNKSRAEETTLFLQELNPDVEGHSISSPLTDWLSVHGALSPYNLILISGPIPLDSLKLISDYALHVSIPIIYIQSAGFHACFSVQLPAEFPIVDTHPDPDSTQDLRLLAPWKELREAVDNLGDLGHLSDHDHGHIPYLFLLLYYLEQWKSEHDGKFPSTFKEKTEFRELVRAGARTNNAEGGEENYDEACSAVLKTINPPSVGGGCRGMFSMPACVEVDNDSSNFWIIAHAIKKFYDSHSVIPLPGGLPDMKATSGDYIKLQNIYKSKARKDVAEVTQTVRDVEQKLGRSIPVPESEIEQFCKNASHVRVLENRKQTSLPILRLAQSDTKVVDELKQVLQNWETISATFVAFNREHINTGDFDSFKAANEDVEDAVKEVERSAGAELHNTSSVIGGMVAQEAIKLLTRQYVPVDGVCIWDGIKSKAEVFKL